MSEFLRLIRHRFEKKNEQFDDYVPWELDDKHNAYQFVESHGWRVPRFVRCGSAAEALEVGASLSPRFVVKQPNQHSSQGVYVLEQVDGRRYIDLLRLTEVEADDIRHVGKAPSYWLAEECVQSGVYGKPIPFDYKVYCINGKPFLIIQIDRNFALPRVAVFDGAFLPLEYGRHYTLDPSRWWPGGHVIPVHAGKLISMCSQLAATLNTKFVSIDTYDGPDGPVFGEFTFAPGAPDVGMIRFPPEILAAFDRAVRGEFSGVLSGIDISYTALLASAESQFLNPTCSSELRALVAAAGAGRDQRYGDAFFRLLGDGLLSKHFRLSAAMIGLLNGNGEHAFYIQGAIMRRDAFVFGGGRLDEFREKALSYHDARSDQGRHPWHTCRAAEIRYAAGDRSAIEVVRAFAEKGYPHAQRVINALFGGGRAG